MNIRGPRRSCGSKRERPGTTDRRIERLLEGDPPFLHGRPYESLYIRLQRDRRPHWLAGTSRPRLISRRSHARIVLRREHQIRLALRIGFQRLLQGRRLFRAEPEQFLLRSHGGPRRRSTDSPGPVREARGVPRTSYTPARHTVIRLCPFPARSSIR